MNPAVRAGDAGLRFCGGGRERSSRGAWPSPAAKRRRKTAWFECSGSSERRGRRARGRVPGGCTRTRAAICRGGVAVPVAVGVIARKARRAEERVSDQSFANRVLCKDEFTIM